jgi:SAM-dependent methyltransferase
MARSATVPAAGQSDADVVAARAEAWNNRPLLRDIYHRYFAEMVANFARDSTGAPGKVVEIGGGSGNFKTYFPNCICTDIVPTPFVDFAADACHLPFGPGSIDNLVMQDVLHHIPYPLAFFAEAQRVLRPGGRIVMTEPYASPFFRLVCKIGHPEPVDMSVRLFPEEGASAMGGGAPDPVAFTGQGAFASNQAIPTVLFYRDRARFAARFPRLRILKRLRRSFFVYPLSGGFSGPQLLPRPLIPLAWGIEACLRPLAPLMALRLVVVIERGRE